MGLHQSLVTEHRDARDGVHVLGVQEVNELGQIMERSVVASQQRVFEGDGHAAITVFYVEHNGIAAYFPPMTDDLNSVVTRGHESGEINSSHFKITVDWN